MHYPKPDRSSYEIKKDKAEDGSIDIGWNEGFLSDARPFRAECWAQDQVTALTIFFSTKGLENYSDKDFKNLLEKEGLVKFAPGEAHVSAMPVTDASGNDMWSVNIVVGDEEETYVLDSVVVRPYERR